jgi:hypothetical protein
VSFTATLVGERPPPDHDALASEVLGIIRAIEQRLPTVARRDIEAAVVRESVRFRDARVRQFVAILNERAALSSLRTRPTSGE